MAATHDHLSLDLRFIDEASKKLAGYVVHERFRAYLGDIGESFRRLASIEAVGQDWQTSADTDYRVELDPGCLTLDALDALTYAVGTYFYIYARHKHAVARLVRDQASKRVMHLRGFGYHTDMRMPGTSAAFSIRLQPGDPFGRRLSHELSVDYPLFTALSPDDIYMDTLVATELFRGDFANIIDWAGHPPLAFYLNANHWRDDMARIVDQMDYFIVHLSSITESSLWELDLLQRKRRQRDTTIVFDAETVPPSSAGFDTAFASHTGAAVHWSGSAVPVEGLTAQQLGERLARHFRVVVPRDQFFEQIAQTRARIEKSSATASIHVRGTPVAFRFQPAVDEGRLRDLQDYHQRLMSRTESGAHSSSIGNLPWCMNIVRLGVITGLMLGKHDDAGRALARYAAVVSVLLRRSFPLTGTLANLISRDQETGVRNSLQEHLDVAEHMSWALLTSGQAHEFADLTHRARRVYDREFMAASGAVEAFMDRMSSQQ